MAGICTSNGVPKGVRDVELRVLLKRRNFADMADAGRSIGAWKIKLLTE